MTKIYLVRHADVHNPKRLIYGRLGFFKLSRLGVQQSKDLAKYFKNKNIAHIYSSPMLRARQTTKAIAGGKIPISYSFYLTEANYKKWEGKPFLDRPASDMKLYLNHPTKLKAGETAQEIQDRMILKINKILKKHQNETIIIVSHADPITATRLYYEKRSLDLLTKIPIKKASLTILDFDSSLECSKVEYKEVTYAPEESP